MSKVLVSASHFDTLCQDAWKLFEENGIDVVFDPAKEFPAYTTEEIENHPDREDIVAALIGMDDFRDERKYQALPNLKAVAKFGVGVDNIDGELAKKYGVKALNAPGQNSNAVAELTVAMILDLLRHVLPLHIGAIARLVAKKLQCFDVEVIAFDLYPNEQAAKELGVRMTTQEEVITRSDIVSIHIPATPETHHLFNKETIASMKDGAYLINPARGALVDLDAVAAALTSGKLAGAAMDAFEVEPLPLDSPILICENIVLTPHTGAETKESYYNVSMTTAKDIIKVIKGEEPEHCVNK